MLHFLARHVWWHQRVSNKHGKFHIFYLLCRVKICPGSCVGGNWLDPEGGSWGLKLGLLRFLPMVIWDWFTMEKNRIWSLKTFFFFDVSTNLCCHYWSNMIQPPCPKPTTAPTPTSLTIIPALPHQATMPYFQFTTAPYNVLRKTPKPPCPHTAPLYRTSKPPRHRIAPHTPPRTAPSYHCTVPRYRTTVPHHRTIPPRLLWRVLFHSTLGKH